MAINSNKKGALGERKFAAFLKSMGIDARRGQQFSGSTDSPDVVTDIEGVHFECKYVKRLRLNDALDQAKKDSGDKIPVVAWSQTFGAKNEWYLILRGEDIFRFTTELLKSR